MLTCAEQIERLRAERGHYRTPGLKPSRVSVFKVDMIKTETRNRPDLTYQHIADKLGVSKRAVRRYSERGEG